MYKFRAKSNIVLGVLSVLSLLAFIVVENSKVEVKQDWYNEKLEAAKLSQLAANHLKNHRLEKGILVDDINDPNQTAMIGQEYTMITTSRGDINAKLASTNPNFAAVIVQLLKDAGVNEEDNVAIAMTGSFPCINISVLSAIKTLNLNPIIISSVGSSNWGANDPYFTWLDMENILYKSKIINSKSIAASIGGGADVGRGLSPKGRNLIIEAIERNNVDFIQEEHLEKSIAKRMEIYQKQSNGKKIKAFINVGGGIASLGNQINGKLIRSGLTKLLPSGNYPMRGVMIQMGQNEVPIIHILNLSRIMNSYGLPNNSVPNPEPGEGKVFIQKRYNLLVTSISLIILVIVILIVYFSERKQQRLGEDAIPVSKSKYSNKDETDNIPVI